jgi:xylan 1,4-beta-xylosidase
MRDRVAEARRQAGGRPLYYTLNLHAIPKPVYRAFELHHLGIDRLGVQGAHETVDAWVIRKERSATVLIINHAQPRRPIATELVNVQLTNAPAPRPAHVERIDETHANPQRAWVEMGEPAYPSALEVEQLKAASRVVKEPVGWKYDGRTIHLGLDLPPHGVAAVTLEFPAGALEAVEEAGSGSGPERAGL